MYVYITARILLTSIESQDNVYDVMQHISLSLYIYIYVCVCVRVRVHVHVRVRVCVCARARALVNWY
jgi:hypothetical protein